MNKFLTVALLPCWLLGALWYRVERGHWLYVPPSAYADSAAEEKDWLCLTIAVLLWLLAFLFFRAVLLLLRHFA